MKNINLAAPIILFLTISAFSAHAATEQKIIMVKGDKSFLMDGDTYKSAFNKPKGYSRDSVLPALLSIGWRIISVNVNEKSTEKSLYGYVVIQRDLPVKDELEVDPSTGAIGTFKK